MVRTYTNDSLIGVTWFSKIGYAGRIMFLFFVKLLGGRRLDFLPFFSSPFIHASP